MNNLETRPPIRQLAELEEAESNIWYVRKKNNVNSQVPFRGFGGLILRMNVVLAIIKLPQAFH